MGKLALFYCEVGQTVVTDKDTGCNNSFFGTDKDDSYYAEKAPRPTLEAKSSAHQRPIDE